MAVDRLWVRNFRSLVDVSMPMRRCTVIQGANATGKMNIYRSTLARLVSDATGEAPIALKRRDDGSTCIVDGA